MPDPVKLTPERVAQIRELLDAQDIGDVELLEAWDGDTLDDLATLLSEEEFQTLLDHLADADEEDQVVGGPGDVTG